MRKGIAVALAALFIVIPAAGIAQYQNQWPQYQYGQGPYQSMNNYYGQQQQQQYGQPYGYGQPQQQMGSSYSTPNPQTVNVTILDDSYSPATITVAPGTTVIWRNSGMHAHTVTADNGAFGSGSLASGQEYRYTFWNVGTYTYHCIFHPNMRGTVIVQQTTQSPPNPYPNYQLYWCNGYYSYSPCPYYYDYYYYYPSYYYYYPYTYDYYYYDYYDPWWYGGWNYNYNYNGW